MGLSDSEVKDTSNAFGQSGIKSRDTAEYNVESNQSAQVGAKGEVESKQKSNMGHRNEVKLISTRSGCETQGGGLLRIGTGCYPDSEMSTGWQMSRAELGYPPLHNVALSGLQIGSLNCRRSM